MSFLNATFNIKINLYDILIFTHVYYVILRVGTLDIKHAIIHWLQMWVAKMSSTGLSIIQCNGCSLIFLRVIIYIDTS